MNEKLITVITTVYNKAPFLKTWAESVASQTYLDKARILVIDDGSTDDSVALIQKYADEYGISGELYLHEKNQGVLRAILDAYHLLDTKYLTVLDPDDYWTSPQKLEKAVKFLEAHDDYSCYFSNVWIEYSNGNRHPYFSTDTPNKTFCKAEEYVYSFTSSAVFRNFFTPELLDEMERASQNYRSHIYETEILRNFLAYKFGKVYFENSLDAVWRDGGFFNSSSNLERSLMLMNFDRQLVEFCAKQFGLNDVTCLISLKWCLNDYLKSVDEFVDMLKQLTITEFKAGKYFRDMFFDYGDSDAEKIFNALIEQINFFKQIVLLFAATKQS